MKEIITYRELVDLCGTLFAETELDTPILAYNPVDSSYTPLCWIWPTIDADILAGELIHSGIKPKTVFPYYMLEHWVFDAPEHNLKEEAFVEGMTEIIERIVTEKKIPDARTGFCLSFSNMPFTGAHCVLTKEQGGGHVDGNWYQGYVLGIPMRGWLCPSLYSYFQEAPDFLFFGATPKT